MVQTDSTGQVPKYAVDLFEPQSNNFMFQDKYRARPSLDPAGADAEEARRLYEDPGRKDEGCTGGLLRYFCHPDRNGENINLNSIL